MLNPPRTPGLSIGLTLLVADAMLTAGQYHRLSGCESTTATIKRAQIETIAVNAAYAPDVTYSYTVDSVAAGTESSLTTSPAW